MEVEVIWNNKLSFSGLNDIDFSVPLDAESVDGGENGGFKPMELLAIGLAGCTAMDTISILQKKKPGILRI